MHAAVPVFKGNTLTVVCMLLLAVRAPIDDKARDGGSTFMLFYPDPLRS